MIFPQNVNLYLFFFGGLNFSGLYNLTNLSPLAILLLTKKREKKMGGQRWDILSEKLELIKNSDDTPKR